MPATLMFYKFYLQPLDPFVCCCTWKDDVDVYDSDEDDLDHKDSDDKMKDDVEDAYTTQLVAHKQNIIERFFGGPWNRAVYRYRCFFIWFFLAWTVITALFAKEVKPLNLMEDFLPKGNELHQA